MSTHNPIPIPVQIARDGSHLSLDRQEVDLREGESIQWMFPTLLPGELAIIHFQPQLERPFGPFQSLAHNTFGVLGFGNTGHLGSTSYTALIVKEDGPVAVSDGTAVIRNHSIHPDTSPEAIVRIEGQTITVDPPVLKLAAGQTAVWYVRGVEPEEADRFVTFDFFDSANPMLGPFHSFFVSRGFGTARVVFGINFVDPRPAQQTVLYRVQLRAANGSVLDFKDPTIEPLGPPPNTAPAVRNGAEEPSALGRSSRVRRQEG